MRIFLLIWATISLSGCFWVSSPPDLNNQDQPKKLVVIWDQIISKDTIERSAWLTTDKARLQKLVQFLDTKTWKSSTVLPSCHLTRIILTMESGKIWEICQSTGTKKRFRMFDRNDRGWSGSINWSNTFLQALTTMIESESGYPINLTIEHRKAISNGTLHKVIPIGTQELLDDYPGYPEQFWNKNTHKFEYRPG